MKRIIDPLKDKTPFEYHKGLNHKTTKHSPNGIDQIEECITCKARFLHQPNHEPTMMYPYYGTHDERLTK